MAIKINQQEERRGRILFGYGANEIRLTRLAKATGLSEDRLGRRRRQPNKVTLEEAALIVKARGLNNEEILALFR